MHLGKKKQKNKEKQMNYVDLTLNKVLTLTLSECFKRETKSKMNPEVLVHQNSIKLLEKNACTGNGRYLSFIFAPFKL